MGRSLDTFKNCNIAGHSELLDYLQLRPNSKHKAHGLCRHRLANDAKKACRDWMDAFCTQQQRKTRSMTGGFLFSEMCFLCGEPCCGSDDMRKVLSGEAFDSSVRDVILHLLVYPLCPPLP